VNEFQATADGSEVQTSSDPRQLGTKPGQIISKPWLNETKQQNRKIHLHLVVQLEAFLHTRKEEENHAQMNDKRKWCRQKNSQEKEKEGTRNI